MYKNALTGKRRFVLIGIVTIIILIVFCSVYISKNKVNAPEIMNNNFQELSNTDFSNVDSEMPEESLDNIKEVYFDIQEKLEIDPLDYDANIVKANILYRTKEYDKAILVYQKLAELNPDDYATYKSMGDVYYAQKKYEEAESAYLTALKNNAHNPTVYSQLAELYKHHLTDDNNGIKKFFEDGIENLGVNRFNLIQAYADYLEYIGEIENSITQWKIVSAEFPDNQPIKDRITELESRLK